MDFKYKLSIIIPCYNCEKTIKRTLESIVNNDLNKEEYQVIIVNDNCIDDSMNIIKQYEDKINITYCKTTRKIHCPGNTRQAGIPYIKGEWTTFIDNDDTFKLNIFQKVFQIIKDNNIQYILSTGIQQIYLNNDTVDLDINYVDGWLHGKFYNTENIFYKLKISFKEDMVGQEDVYFNSSLQAKLYLEKKDFYREKFYTYEWRQNPKSFTYTQCNNDWNYTDKYMEEYIEASTSSYLSSYKENLDKEIKDIFISVIMTSFLFSYFYYQGSVYRGGTTLAFKNAIFIHNLKEKIKKVFNCNDAFIIDYVYLRPELYMNVRNRSVYSNGDFIELQSFRDFVTNI